MCQHFDTQNALSDVSAACDLLIYCWNDETSKKMMQNNVLMVNSNKVLDLFEMLCLAASGIYSGLFTKIWNNSELFEFK